MEIESMKSVVLAKFCGIVNFHHSLAAVCLSLSTNKYTNICLWPSGVSFSTVCFCSCLVTVHLLSLGMMMCLECSITCVWKLTFLLQI